MGKAAVAGLGLGLASSTLSFGAPSVKRNKSVGIIGLDTSHSIAFAKAFNASDAASDLCGYKVVAA